MGNVASETRKVTSQKCLFMHDGSNRVSFLHMGKRVFSWWESPLHLEGFLVKLDQSSVPETMSDSDTGVSAWL